MIQRIQTIYLFLALLSFVGIMLFPVAQSEEAFGTIMADREFVSSEHLWMAIFALTGGLITLFNIFLYHKRKYQMRFAMLANLFTLIWVALAFYGVNQLDAQASDLNSVWHSYAFITAGTAILFGTLAYYSIKKDEKLVRSMNSLR